MKKVCTAIPFILVFGVIIILFVRANSFSIAINRAGFNANDVHTIEHSFDSNEREFKVIKTSSKEHEIVLAIITKNNLGFWTITSKSGKVAANPNLISIGWIRGGGAKRFIYTENAEFENEWHIAYYGNKATKLIYFLPGQIPENVTVNIQQAGELFWIHIITFANPDVLNSIDIQTLLIKNQCITVE